MEARRTCLISLEGDGQLSLVGSYEKALLAWWSRWAWFAMLGRNRRVLDEDLPVVDLMTLYIYILLAQDAGKGKFPCSELQRSLLLQVLIVQGSGRVKMAQRCKGANEEVERSLSTELGRLAE